MCSLLERVRKEAKEKDVQRFETELVNRAVAQIRHRHVKQIGTEFKTRVMLDTVLGGPSRAIQESLHEKDLIVYKPAVYPDSMKMILTFNKNMRLGRAHYVSYAVTAGFQSINWVDAEFGNTGLHSAVQVLNIPILPC